MESTCTEPVNIPQTALDALRVANFGLLFRFDGSINATCVPNCANITTGVCLLFRSSSFMKSRIINHKVLQVL